MPAQVVQGMRSRRIAITLLIGIITALWLSITPALAEDTSIRGTLKDPETSEGIPGVKILVDAPGFSQETETDESGAWAVVVPGEGDYVVTLDASSLPEGITLRDPDRVSLEVLALEGRGKTVLFPLGEGTGVQRSSLWSQVPQLTVDGLIFGLVIALAAVGLSLIFGTTKLTNFAHGELIALGALLAYFFSSVVGLPLIFAIVVSVFASAFLGGWLQNKVLWKQLRKQGTGIIAALVVSIGLGFLLRYFFLFIFGGQTRQYNEWAGQSGLQLGPVLITPKDLISSTVAILLIAATTWWLLKTQAGKATRAVADNPALASASGIEVERVISTVWILGAGLAAFSGVMIGLQAGVGWFMGFQVLLLVFAGTILGGLGTAFGAILGSLIVGVFIQVSTLIIPTELKYVGALVVLIIILLVRPQGILGKAERIG